MTSSPFYDQMSFGYGLKGYASLILFTGTCMMASTVAVAYPLILNRGARAGGRRD